MAWDSTRPVPWQRLIREWLIYVAVMAVVLLVVLRDTNITGSLAGLLVSGPMYLVLGFVLAKFGYQRKSFKQKREAQSEPRSKKSKTTETDEPVSRRPAPTKRTSGGDNRPRKTTRSKPRRS